MATGEGTQETCSVADLEGRIQRLETENETLRALLLLKNVEVEFNADGAGGESSADVVDHEPDVYRGDPKTVAELVRIKGMVKELRLNYLLARAEVVVMNEQVQVLVNELKRHVMQTPANSTSS